MTVPVELFIALARHLEDLHGLAVEGQSADQPPELMCILAEQSCNGLLRCKIVLDQIKFALGAP